MSDNNQNGMEICTLDAAKVMIGSLMGQINLDDPYQTFVAYYLMPIECCECYCRLDEVLDVEVDVGTKEWVQEVSWLMRERGWHVPKLDDDNIISISAKCPKCYNGSGKGSGGQPLSRNLNPQANQ